MLIGFHQTYWIKSEKSFFTFYSFTSLSYPHIIKKGTQ